MEGGINGGGFKFEMDTSGFNRELERTVRQQASQLFKEEGLALQREVDTVYESRSGRSVEELKAVKGRPDFEDLGLGVFWGRDMVVDSCLVDLHRRRRLRDDPDKHNELAS